MNYLKVIGKASYLLLVLAIMGSLVGVFVEVIFVGNWGAAMLFLFAGLAEVVIAIPLLEYLRTAAP